MCRQIKICTLSPTSGLMENRLPWGVACGHSGTSCKPLGSLEEPTVSGEACLSLLYPHPLLTPGPEHSPHENVCLLSLPSIPASCKWMSNSESRRSLRRWVFPRMSSHPSLTCTQISPNKWNVDSKAVLGKESCLVCDYVKHHTKETF